MDVFPQFVQVVELLYIKSSPENPEYKHMNCFIQFCIGETQFCLQAWIPH